MKTLSITIGVPGSGKSTWLAKYRPDAKIISRDAIRFSLLDDDDDYFAYEDEVLSIFYKKINTALNNDGGPEEVIIDATHLSPHGRNKLFANIDFTNVEKKVAYYFDVDIKTCLARNRLRTGRALVPDSVIYQMAKTRVYPEDKEAFDWIYVINSEGELV